MANKVYKKSKKNSNKKVNDEHKNDENMLVFTIRLLLIFIIFIIITLVPLPWSIYSPGGAINLTDNLENKNEDSNGDISMSYITFQDGRIFNILGALVIPSWDIVSNEDISYEGQDLKETEARELIGMYTAISNATEVAYKRNDTELNIESKDFYIARVYDKEASNLKVGDIIRSYDGRMMTSFDEFSLYIENLDIGDIVKFKVERDEKIKTVESRVVEIEEEKKLGLVIEVVNNYSKDTVTYVPKEKETGPSCGLMLSLAIYDAISDEDLADGRHLCGTGTIDSEGNVGIIGGIKYKMIGSEKDKCDVFFIPKDNEEEAKEVLEEHDLDMEFIVVSTFDEAIEALNK